MRKSGVQNYEKFARSLLKKSQKNQFHLVFADDIDEMHVQAKKIAS